MFNYEVEFYITGRVGGNIGCNFCKFGKYCPITAPNITSVQYRLLLIMWASDVLFFRDKEKKVCEYVTMIVTKRYDQF